MKLRLTDLSIRKLGNPQDGQVTHWDATTPGFGIRCSAKSKSYVVMYGAKRRLKTIGRYPALSLSDARRQAKLFLASQATVPNDAIEHDYQDVLLAYMADCHSRLRPSTLEGYLLYLNGIKLNGLISEITQRNMMHAIERFTTSPTSRNYAFTTFKVFFNWAVRMQYVTVNPLSNLKRPHKTGSRDRVLSEDEIKVLLSYSLGQRDRYCGIVSLLLVTGQRRGEIAGLRWDEISGGWLHFSANRTKNARGHAVPLGLLGMQILDRPKTHDVFVFGDDDSDQPFSGWSRAQRRLLRETGLPHFTLHDLRRTFATVHAKLGTPIHVTERLLNHVSGTVSGVAAVYNRHSYEQEMALAQSTLDNFLSRLIDEP
ncbi:tyrosine-type recombinase/integrase [Yoonia algicola]|uniref:Integrase family protein n=1 Tax=Yoonia algicola TaxID=3137368 RepID=A0AAN0NH11_9RHOB